LNQTTFRKQIVLFANIFKEIRLDKTGSHDVCREYVCEVDMTVECYNIASYECSPLLIAPVASSELHHKQQTFGPWKEMEDTCDEGE
jgi:hypothetical protein